MINKRLKIADSHHTRRQQRCQGIHPTREMTQVASLKFQGEKKTLHVFTMRAAARTFT